MSLSCTPGGGWTASARPPTVHKTRHSPRCRRRHVRCGASCGRLPRAACGKNNACLPAGARRSSPVPPQAAPAAWPAQS
eukprot:347283-Chlamydomonas_euryale.AAC.2